MSLRTDENLISHPVGACCISIMIVFVILSLLIVHIAAFSPSKWYSINRLSQQQEAIQKHIDELVQETSDYRYQGDLNGNLMSLYTQISDSAVKLESIWRSYHIEDALHGGGPYNLTENQQEEVTDLRRQQERLASRWSDIRRSQMIDEKKRW